MSETNRPADGTGRSTIVLVGNAHIDMIYRWRLNETYGRVIPDTFRGVLDVMDRRPEFTYAQSQFALYEVVRDRYPEIWRRIRERIADGRWVVVGGKWIEADAMLPGGESLIRQFVVGDEFCREELGHPTVRVAWIPDSFGGHCHTAPQIYAGCGIEFYLFNRGCPDDIRCFHWEAPDGTRLFAYKIPKHYNLTIDDELDDVVRDWTAITRLSEALILYGEGDHGGGPRDGDIDAVEALNRSSDFSPILTHGRPDDVLERARAARDDWPVYQGDLGVPSGVGTYRGAHVSQARLKRLHRRLEHDILVAERTATIGAMLQRKFFFPRYDMRGLWKRFLLHQFHDTLPGTIVGDAADDVITEYTALLGEADRVLTFGLEAIGARLDTRGEHVPVMVFNPSPWRRTDHAVCTITRPVPERVVRITDPDGHAVPFVCEPGAALEHTIRFLARDLPSLGYRLYRVECAAVENVEPEPDRTRSRVTLDSAARSAENEFFSVSWNDAGVTHIYDKRGGRDLLAGEANVLRLLREDESSSWHVDLTGDEVRLEPVDGPIVLRADEAEARVRWVDRSADSRFTRDLVLRAGIDRVEFELVVEWHEADHLLAVSFPTASTAGVTTYEAPYGSIERAADGTFWPVQKWLVHANESFGVALVNDGAYSCRVLDDAIEVAVVRGARDMDPRMDEGRTSLRYAITGTASADALGEKNERTRVTRAAHDFAEPLLARQQIRHVGSLPNWGEYKSDFSLPDDHSFAAIDAEHTILTVFKVLEGDWNPGSLIVRVYEIEGREETVTVRLPKAPSRVREVNHIEHDIPGAPDAELHESSFTFTIAPHQIRTFRIDLGRAAEGG